MLVLYVRAYVYIYIYVCMYSEYTDSLCVAHVFLCLWTCCYFKNTDQFINIACISGASQGSFSGLGKINTHLYLLNFVCLLLISFTELPIIQ